MYSLTGVPSASPDALAMVMRVGTDTPFSKPPVSVADTDVQTRMIEGGSMIEGSRQEDGREEGERSDEYYAEQIHAAGYLESESESEKHGGLGQSRDESADGFDDAVSVSSAYSTGSRVSSVNSAVSRTSTR